MFIYIYIYINESLVKNMVFGAVQNYSDLAPGCHCRP